MPIDRTQFNALIDDDGTGAHGSVWNKAAIQSVLLDPIDAMYSEVITVTTPGAIDNLALNPTKSVHVLVYNAGADVTFSGTLAGATEGTRLIIVVPNTGRVNLLHYGRSNVPLLLPVTSVVPGLPVCGSWRGSAEFIYSAAANCWMLLHHEQGTPITVPYSASNYFSDTGTWTTNASNTACSYYVKGATAHVVAGITGGSLSATCSYLYSSWPFAFAVQTIVMGDGNPISGGISRNVVSSIGGNLLAAMPAAGGQWPANGGSTNLDFSGSFRIQ